MTRGIPVLWLVLAVAPAALAGAVTTPAPAAEPAAPDRELFLQGYDRYEAGDHEAAAVLLRRYLDAAPAGDPDADWAEFFLGISLYRLGFSHAAVDTLSPLVARRPNAKVVAYALEILEEITRTRPFDREQVLLDVVVDREYGFVDERLGDFIHYYQGLFDWEHGYRQWGDDHFARIRPGTYYHDKYRYQDALYRLYDGDLDGAQARLRDLLAGGIPDADLRDEVRVTLARILYERERFDEADRLYRQVEKPNVQQARYLLERAWTQYRKGDPQRAMGLLYAFRAPSFWRDFSPEYFILKSFVYKDVCHYQTALAVVDEFKARYGPALAFIYGRGPVEESDELLQILLQRPAVAEPYRFLRLLSAEQARIDGMADPGLAAYLGRIYDLQVAQTSRELRDRVRAAYETLATNLLRYEEQAHLLEYEIGLDMYQRASDYRYRPPKTDTRTAGDGTSEVAFAFQGEFWNDELDDYRVVLDDRCGSSEQWDVFFK